ncbi:MAG: twin-arginine translocation signal domain-containing protein, partial [Dehalococcoidia bacterium]
MSNISRRDFLKVALAGLGALAAARLLNACAPAVTPPVSIPVSTSPYTPVENGTKNTSYP